ncbi:MAG: EpsG family protein [Bacteroidales bacterium]|nr:EpsG family protein [Bacteroidales bacterium]
METLLIILLIIAGLFFSNLARVAFKHNWVAYVLSFSLVFIASGLLTYTPDWVGYEAWIEKDIGRDVFFNFFVHNVLPADRGYQFVHIFFVATYTVLMIMLISKFTDQILLVVVLYLAVVYLFYSTQIRFFMGYYAMSLAFYYWFVENKRRMALFFMVFAVLNHASLLFLLPFIYFFTVDVEVLIRRVALFLSLIVIVYFISSFFLTDETQDIVFLTYLASAEHESSLLGGLFSFLPWFISFFLIHLYAKRKISEYPSLLQDKKFQYLYRFMIISITFIGISLERQVVGQRFIIPSAIFQIMLLLYIARYNERRQNFTLAGIGTAYFLAYMFYYYILSMEITSSNVTEMVSEMLQSNIVIRLLLNP